jgi:eukaryotic translation initiation factor 2C
MGNFNPNELERDFTSHSGNFYQACSKLLGMYFTVRHMKTEHANAKKMKFGRWTMEDAERSMFDETGDDGIARSTSVSDYYQRKYNITLRFPKLPMAGTPGGALFPLELCYSASGERYRDVLQGQETSDFIQFATCPATVRRSQIGDGLKLLAWHDQKIPRMHGLSCSPNLLQIKARILNAPQIVYGGNRVVVPNDGRWNLRGVRLLRAASIKSWALLYLPNRPAAEQVVSRFCGEIQKGFGGLGMAVPHQPPPYIMGNPQGDMRQTLNDCIAKANSIFRAPPDIIFVVLGATSTPIYAGIKKILDCQFGIASQVMIEDKAFKCQPQYIANNGVKVNVKLGGTNSTIVEPIFKQRRFMLIGGDCSLPSPSALRRDPPPPATVALTATWDKDCTAYTAVASMQPSSTANNIVNATPMFQELLKRYKEKNNGLMPESIIYFRDGASESEFDTIRDSEGKALKALCDPSGTRITIIFAIKRHHTRFFLPQSHEKYGSRLGNVPPGTVVENSGHRNDVFMVAHTDLQGTKRPTRYVITVDDNRLPADDFQRLCYGLCSSYARATVSVAVVPPIYYADQACERARLHLDDAANGSQILRPVHGNLQWNMYWQ